MARLQNLLIVLGVCSLTLAQTSQSSPATLISSSTFAATSTAANTTITFANTISSTTQELKPTDYVWHMPLVGLSDNASVPWGVVVVDTLNKVEKTYTVNISDINPVPPNSQHVPNPTVIEYAEMVGNATGDQLVVTTNGTTDLILGMNSVLNITAGSLPVADATIPTVPFGLNFGQKGSWNGSLVFGNSVDGESYDANRVANGSWIYLPPVTGRSFLSHGRIQLENVTIQAYNISSSSVSSNSTGPFNGASPSGQPQAFRALLDINNDAIVLPLGLNFCNSTNFTITVGGYSIGANVTDQHAQNLTITIPTTLTHGDRCWTSQANGTTPTVILGRPFLQAAYMLVSAQNGGLIWLAPAHNYDLPIKPAPFAANLTLTAAAAPLPPTSTGASPTPTASQTPSDTSSPTASTSTSTSASASAAPDSKINVGAIAGGTLGAISGAALLAGAVVFFLRKRNARRRDPLSPVDRPMGFRYLDDATGGRGDADVDADADALRPRPLETGRMGEGGAF